MKTNVLTVVASVALSALAAWLIVSNVGKGEGNASGTGKSDPASYRTVNLSETDFPDFTFAAESAVDAVVYVEVVAKSAQQYQIDPLFQFFFGDGRGPQMREQKVSGSGVIIREDGYIVTNNHVIANASSVSVTLNNNQTLSASIVGTDPATDVALLKVDAPNLPFLELEDSDRLRLGEWVLAIGSPLGEQLRSTITAGIVSAKGRSMPSQNGEFKIESFIQTDAAVNPGNSGGALVNKAGRLVGINTAIISTTGSFSGYSFAVPSNIVKKIVGDLIDFGSVKRAFLGITMSPVDEKTAAELKLSVPNGVLVNEVSKGSSADKAGLKSGDVIVGVDSTVIKTPSDLQAKVNTFHPGDNAVLKINRKGDAKELAVTFQGTVDATGVVAEDGTTAFYGGKLGTPSKEKLAFLGLKRGVEIVDPGSGVLADAGAQQGAIILYVNDKAVSRPQDVIDLAEKSRRAVYVEGVDANGKPFYFGFGKQE